MYEVIAKNTQAELPLEFGLECISAALRNTLIGLLGREEFPIRFEFPYPQPAYADRYVEVLGDDVHFDQSQMKWTFPASLLEATLPSSNQALHDLYESECARLLADLRDAGFDLALAAMGLPQDGDAAFAFALRAEGHGDNAAPSIFGGLRAVATTADGPVVMGMKLSTEVATSTISNRRSGRIPMAASTGTSTMEPKDI